uniref:actin maturation protease n=1 Tax=Lonchura striata TaxID=40157 RepID=UPI000B4DC924
MFPGRFRDVSGTFPGRFWDVPGMFPGHFRDISGDISGMFPGRSGTFPDLLPACPAAQLASLAQELLPCRAELLQGGLGGPNRARILRHLLGGQPLLVPYDGDSNHAPCCRRGHRAHWALLNGLLLAVPPQAPLGPGFQRDPEVPNVFHARGFGSGGFRPEL